MKKLNEKQLSLLSLLAIVGLLLTPLTCDSWLIIISWTFCAIGGLSFGILAKRQITNK